MSEEPQPLVLPGNGTRILLAILWPGLALLGLVMLGSVAMVIGIAHFTGTGAGDIAKLLGEAHGISKLASLVIIVPSILVLALTDKVPGSAAVAALSAVAGYLLGSAPG